MLVLNRRQNEELVIGGGIRVRVLRVRGKSVSLAIDAPECVSILRSEIVDQNPASATEAFSVVRLRESASATLVD